MRFNTKDKNGQEASGRNVNSENESPVVQRVFVDERPETAQLKSLQAIASNKVLQLQTSINFQPQNYEFIHPDFGRSAQIIGSRMNAYLDPQDPIKGTPTNGGEIPQLMYYLQQVYPNRSRGWHRGHLLNARLGGLNIAQNLGPIPESLNTGAHPVAEELVKRIVGFGVPVNYSVEYTLMEDQQGATTRMIATVVPSPENDFHRTELVRRGDSVKGGVFPMEATVKRSDNPNRTGSPEPARMGALDGAEIFMTGAYSHHNDARLDDIGWGKRDSPLNGGEQFNMEQFAANGPITSDVIRKSNYGARTPQQVEIFNQTIDGIRGNAMEGLRRRLYSYYYQRYSQRYGPDEGDDWDYQHNVIDASTIPLQWVPEWDDYDLTIDNEGIRIFAQSLNDEVNKIFDTATGRTD